MCEVFCDYWCLFEDWCGGIFNQIQEDMLCLNYKIVRIGLDVGVNIEGLE